MPQGSSAVRPTNDLYLFFFFTQNYITTAEKIINYIIKNRAMWATDYDFITQGSDKSLA